MKNYIKLAIAALIVSAPIARADFNLSSVNKVVSEVGGPAEAKNLYQSAKKGYTQASDEVKRIQGEIDKIKAECPASALNPFNKSTFKMSCAQKTAQLALQEIKLKAEQAKQLWNNELMQKLRTLIEKNWPAVKKQLGF